MERIGIYGGTFNPPHIGHLQAAEAAIEALDLTKLILIPDRIAPHKVIPAGSPSPEQRLAMVQLAAKHPAMEVSDMELKRQGPSYTYQTILQLRQIYPNAELVLLMGTDMFLSFLNWRNPDVILSHASLGVFYRGEKGELEAIEAKKAEMERMGHKISLVKNEVVQISSTQLRRLLAFRCAQSFLPGGVAGYILENGLYETTADLTGLSLEELEGAVKGLLDPRRVDHVLGCRDAAVQLAKRWGANETDAARAGLLHDITKALDGPLQLTLCSEYGTILSDFSRRYPKTLHALTGALVAERIFGENREVVEAIRHHTTGKANMSLLEKIIYVADYIEPNRNFPGVDDLRDMAYEDIDKALKMGLEMTLRHLSNLGDEVSPASREALEYLT